MEPLRRWAESVIDTSRMRADDLQALTRERYALDDGLGSHILVTSFGYSRGLPPNADLVFDMRFLRNPHWDSTLKPMTGLDAEVGAYVAADPAFDAAVTQIFDLLTMLLPRYEAAGKAYVTIAFGCTGGRHRSVYVAEYMAKRLQDAGFSPTVAHRNLASRPDDQLEGVPLAPARHENQR